MRKRNNSLYYEGCSAHICRQWVKTPLSKRVPGFKMYFICLNERKRFFKRDCGTADRVRSDLSLILIFTSLYLRQRKNKKDIWINDNSNQDKNKGHIYNIPKLSLTIAEQQ